MEMRDVALGVSYFKESWVVRPHDDGHFASGIRYQIDGHCTWAIDVEFAWDYVQWIISTLSQPVSPAYRDLFSSASE